MDPRWRVTKGFRASLCTPILCPRHKEKSIHNLTCSAAHTEGNDLSLFARVCISKRKFGSFFVDEFH